ncbi:hypothetical protein N9B82_02655 [Saprospiraceae bacterium]|nr:hypothetical protein [Saprospiraceae bacterium]
MKKLSLLILLINLCSQVTSQVSGYLGKKMIVEVGLYLSPAIYESDLYLLNFKDHLPNTLLNPSFEISVDYITSRRGMWGLRAGHQNSWYTLTAENNYSSNFARMSIFKTGFRYSTFNRKKGGFSPIGRANSFGVDAYSIYKTELGETSLSEGRTLLFSLSYAFSNRHIINDRFLLKYGVDFNLPLALPIYISDSPANELISANSNSFTTQLFYREFYKIQISIGYIIF